MFYPQIELACAALTSACDGGRDWERLCDYLALRDPPDCSASNAMRLSHLRAAAQFRATWALIGRVKATVNPARYYLAQVPSPSPICLSRHLFRPI